MVTLLQSLVSQFLYFNIELSLLNNLELHVVLKVIDI